MKRIVITAGGSGNSDDNNNTGNAAPVCVSNPVTFEAVMTNMDIGGEGVEWSVQSQPQGVGKTRTLTFPQPDTYEVKAKCGSQSVAIFVVAVKLNIVQGPDTNAVWWFDGEDAHDYDEEVTLTANGASIGAFLWEVTSGADKVDLIKGYTTNDSITTTNDNTVEMRSTKKSLVLNDVKIRLTYQGCEFHHETTVRAPSAAVVVEGPTDTNYNDGFQTTYVMDIRDQFNNPMPGVEINETFGPTTTNYSGANWPPGQQANYWADPYDGTIEDNYDCYGPTLIPSPVNPGAPGWDTKVESEPQYYRAGSLTSDRGILVKTHTLQWYRGKARQE